MDCTVPTIGIIDCGFEGITPQECLAKSCCYDPVLPGQLARPECFESATLEVPVGTILDPDGNVVGAAGEVEDLLPEAPGPTVPLPEGNALPDPTNIPETPTWNHATWSKPVYTIFVLALAIL
jgi:hypothetical protein